MLIKDERHLYVDFYKSPLHPRKRGILIMEGILAYGPGYLCAFPPIDCIGSGSCRFSSQQIRQVTLSIC